MQLSDKCYFVAFANKTSFLHDVNLKYNQYNIEQVFYSNLFKEHMYVYNLEFIPYTIGQFKKL